MPHAEQGPQGRMSGLGTKLHNTWDKGVDKVSTAPKALAHGLQEHKPWEHLKKPEFHVPEMPIFQGKQEKAKKKDNKKKKGR